MRISIITLGSRGDVQPYVALGTALMAAGHTVTLGTHDEFEPFIRSYGLAFAPLAGNPREIVQSERGKAWLESQANPVRFFRGLKELTDDLLDQVAADTIRACADADLIMASTLGLFAAGHVAEARNIPFIPAPLQPIEPSWQVGQSMFPLAPRWLPFGSAYKRLTFTASSVLMWQLFGSRINQMRRDTLNLPQTSRHAWRPKHDQTVLYGFSRHVLPKASDWRANAHVTGYWFLDEEPGWTPPAGLLDFLDAGPKPVYVGFGSMSDRNPEAVRSLVLKALDASRQRAVILTGWGGMSAENLPDHVFAVRSIPHAWLFQRMAAVVHHGGAGTTAAGLRAGVPSLLIPFFADQHFWADRVRQLGVGPAPIPRKRLTADALAAALTQATQDSTMQSRAARLGQQIRDENGKERAAALVDETIPTRA
jgi:UDP:flavonoid glycosyltransferase YjiC (YdhE family)